MVLGFVLPENGARGDLFRALCVAPLRRGRFEDVFVLALLLGTNLFEVPSSGHSGRYGAVQDVLNRAGISSLAPSDVLLVTDFDGTLAEIVPDPSQATPLPESLAALERLAANLGCVAVLSSRTLTDLTRLVRVPGVVLIGDSGLGHLTAEEERALQRFNIEGSTVLSGSAGVRLEEKPGSTTVHYRHAHVTAADLRRLLDPLLQSSGLNAALGRFVIEVSPRRGPKGDALDSLISRRQPRGVICLGDDENDRPMFELVSSLPQPHVVVGVASNEAPPDLFNRCDLVVAGPTEASRFLAVVAEWASDPSAHVSPSEA